MYIIPYYTVNKKVHTNIDVRVVWIFMSNNGMNYWRTEDSDAKKSVKDVVQEYCIENGFVGNVKAIENGKIYYEIDLEKTKVNNFYRWLENNIPEDADLWRPFFLFEGINNENEVLSRIEELIR
jgi:hypothetical protein